MKSCLVTLLALTAAARLGAQNAGEARRPAQHSTANRKNPFEAVREPESSPARKASGPLIEAIEFRGTRRVTPGILKALIVSRAGGVYDVETLRQDMEALQKTQRFSRVFMETEPGPSGQVVRFHVTERPLIETISFEGGGARLAEVLDRLRERNVRLGMGMLYDEDQLPRALAVIEELLAETGRRNFAVTAFVEPGQGGSEVTIIFRATPRQ